MTGEGKYTQTCFKIERNIRDGVFPSTVHAGRQALSDDDLQHCDGLELFGWLYSYSCVVDQDTIL